MRCGQEEIFNFLFVFRRISVILVLKYDALSD